MRIKLIVAFISILLSVSIHFNTHAQIRFIEIDELHIGGQLAHKGNSFHRIDTQAFQDLPDNIKKLMTNSSGMFISFKTNSSQIQVEWCTSVAKTYANLPAIAFEGLDLYIKREGKWVYAGVGRPGSNPCQTHTLVENMDSTEKEMLLYFPLYDELTAFKLGIDGVARIENSQPFSKKMGVYGSSIVQGASASRPGLSYTSKISRNLGIEAINWGVSGSAKMEKSVSRLIGESSIDLLIIDCIPNCSPEHIDERTTLFIQEIRQNHPNLPIIAIAGAQFESGNFNPKIADDMKLRNKIFEKHIQTLMRNDDNLYFLNGEGLLGEDHEGTIDGTHPNDLGFERMTQKIQPVLKNILLKYNLIENFD